MSRPEKSGDQKRTERFAGFRLTTAEQVSLEDRNLAPQFENVFLGTDLLTIPDSVLSDAPKFVVRVEPPNLDTTDDCQDQPVESDFYAFVRQNSSDTSCQTWVAQ